LGGATEELGLAQVGTFFLGAPLPVGGQLYAIAEQKGDIRLLVLDAKTGNVAWAQQLGVVEQDRDILQDPLRRVSGVSPSYADGILVCPTSNRSVVALEPATRSLLWGYVYKSGDPLQPRQPPMFFGVSPSSDPEPANRWAHTEVVLADGRVLVTPVDSAELHCLNVIDGKLLWRKPRQDDLYLACVDRGKVVLVGRRGLRALKLADGEPAWPPRSGELPPAAMPSGTGFLSADRYYLPLSSGEVAAVDLSSGQIVHHYQSRRGVVPGNLVCSGGRVLSQRGGAVELFFQLDALRKQVDDRLAAKPDDADALAQRGEILWDEGKLQDAVDCFRRSLKLAAGPNARSLLRDALLECLRIDFAKYRIAGEEIRSLLDEPRQEAVYLRLMAAGFEQASQFPPALEHYLKLIELDRKQRDLEPVDKSHSVRRDRWIQVRLAELRGGASADVRAEIDRVTQARLDAAVKAGSVEALQQFLDYFGVQPMADRARALLVAKLRDARRLLQAEVLLRRMERSEDRPTAGSAVADMAFMLRDAKLVDDAAACFRRLREEFGDVVCRDGKTGRQLAEAIPADDPLRRRLEPDAPWPTGAIVVERTRQLNTQPMAFYSVTVPYQQGRGPFFGDLKVELHQNPPLLRAVDGWGKKRWELPLGELMRQESFPMTSAFLRVTVHDHLLLLSIGFKIVAVDTLAAGERNMPKVLWVQDLEEPVRTAARRGRGRLIPAGMPGVRGLNTFGNPQFPMNIPAAVSEQLVCYQRFQNLYGVDPVSGEVLWVREDVRPDSVVFGDQQYVFVVPADQSVATVFRAADGKKVGTRPVPSVRPATLGRLAASWRSESSQSVLEVIDPLSDRRVGPSRKFAADAKNFTFENDTEVVGVLEPRGHFTLVNLADGRALVDAPVEREGATSDVHVFRSPEQTLVVINGLERTSSSGRHYYGLQGVPSLQVSRAKIYAFDARGKPLWQKPVTVQDQYLVLHQPQRLPALVFACGVQDRRTASMSQPKTSILAVDKRSGQVVQPKEKYDGLSHFRLTGDPEKKAIQIDLQHDVVTLNFTDKPRVAPAKEEEKKKPAATPSSALLKALRRGAERALNLPSDEDEEDSGDNR
jgi:outer membrane protein assembly factor BamB